MAGHQQVTEDWWRTRKNDFELLVSPLVIQEAGRGDPEAVSRRMALLTDIPVLELTDTAQRLGFPMPFVCTPEELLGGPREH